MTQLLDLIAPHVAEIITVSLIGFGIAFALALVRIGRG
jgi:hypothetical protein